MNKFLPLAFLFSLGATFGAATQKDFTIQGNQLRLEDVTAEVQVHYQSMRFNRAANVWNAEVILTNTGIRTLRAPLILSIDGFSSTSGPLQTDGLDQGAPAKPFYNLTPQAQDGILPPGGATSARTITLGRSTGPPTLTTKVFCLPPAQILAAGLVRSLDGLGHPLSDVQVAEVGPQGSRTYVTDPRFGLATLGQGVGLYSWMFSKAGFLPVWRQQVLNANEVSILMNPKLTERTAPGVPLTPLNGGMLSNADHSIQISFGPGSFSKEATGILTPLTAQTLPAFLPLGWSPLQAFWLELASEPIRSGSASLVLWGATRNGEPAAVVRWSEQNLRWDVIERLSTNGAASAQVAVPGSGAYAVAVGDTGATAPPAPQLGQPLAGSSLGFADFASLKAAGKVEPAVSAASQIPERVTALAEVIFTSPGAALPSGLLLRCEVSERYQLQDGAQHITPRYENFITAYQRPGDSDPATLRAEFPLRPLLLFGSEELTQATVKVDVLSPTPFTGGVLDATGGQIANAGIRVTAGAGDMVGAQAAQIQSLNPINFAGLITGPTNIVAGFELSVSGVAEGRYLTAQFPAQAPNNNFVLARVLAEDGLYGLEPVERLTSDATGKLATTEPSVGERLPGLTGSGQYVLVHVSGPQALVTGLARDSRGQPAANFPIRTTGQPWLTLSARDGRFRLLAPAGQSELVATDPVLRDTGRTAITVTDPKAIASANVSTAPLGLRVVSVSPAEGEMNVPRVAPIVVTFNQALNPGSLLRDGLKLLDSKSQPVGATFSLNLRNTVATLLPTNQLAPNLLHTVVLSADIADPSGRRLEGTTRFTFTTERDSLNRPPGAQVISYEPDTNGLARIVGTQGIADSGAPVILVNETSGQSATVLAKVDGSFSNSVPASVEDFLSAVLVNRNGTRTVIPVSRQIFNDGRVGLFSGGGSLDVTGPDSTVHIEVPPGAIPSKTIFKLESVSITNLLAAFNNTPPANGPIAAALRVERTGDAPTAPLTFTVSVDQNQIGLPPGSNAEDFVFAATTPALVDGVVGYQFLKQATVQSSGGRPGPARTASRNPIISFIFQYAPNIAGWLDIARVAPVSTVNVELFGKVIAAKADLSTGEPKRPIEAIPGAIVTLAAKVEDLPRLRLEAGEMFSVSDTKGLFEFLAPKPPPPGTGFRIKATHPRFPHRIAASPFIPFSIEQTAELGPEVWFVIPSVPDPDTTEPAVVVSHTPPDPAATINAELMVVATDDSGISSVNVLGSRASVTRGPHSQSGLEFREEFLITPQRPGSEALTITVSDGASPPNTRTLRHTIRFGGSPPSGPNPNIPPDPNDHTGPRVVRTTPVDGAVNVPIGTPLIIRFDEAIDSGVPAALTLGNFGVEILNVPGTPTGFLRANQRDLVVDFPAIMSGTRNSVSVSSIPDASPNSNLMAPSFAMSFDTQAITQTGSPGLPDLNDAVGVVTKGAYAYVLDRSGTTAGFLVVYSLADPIFPQKVNEVRLPPYPRDFVMIPQYSYKIFENDVVHTGDLMAVAGGIVGGPQYLWILDINDPTRTIQAIASGLPTRDPTAALTRLDWSAPYLAVIESKAAYPVIHWVDLQTYILGRNLLSDEIERLDKAETPGKDDAGNGDYVDPNDVMPKPGQDTIAFPGNVFTANLDADPANPTLGATGRYISDIAFRKSAIGGTGDLIGAIISSGPDTLIGGNRVPPGGASYRSYLRGQNLPASATSISLLDCNPKSVLLTYASLETTSSGRSRFSGEVAIIAGVTLDNSANKLFVVDLTNPTMPTLLSEILIPTRIGPINIGRFQRIMEAPNPLGNAFSSRFHFAVSTADHILVFDKGRLGNPVSLFANVEAVPGLVAIFSDAGAGNSRFTYDWHGIAISAAHGSSMVTVFSPLIGVGQIQLFGPPVPVDVLNAPDLLSPAQHVLLEDEEEPTQIATVGPGPALNQNYSHYYARVFAPGAAGNEIELLVQATLPNGRDDPGTFGFLPPSQLQNVKARRVSDDPKDPAYNVYLSVPIAMVNDNLSPADYQSLGVTPVVREIIFSAYSFRVSLSPSMRGNSVLGRFAP